MMKSELTKIDYDVSSFTLKEWICSLIEIMGIVSLVNYLCYRILWLSVLGIPFGYWYIRWKKRKKKEQRRKKLEYQFFDVLQAIYTAIRAGYSMERAVSECKKEIEQIYGPQNDFVKELAFMEKQMKFRVPIEKLFMDLGHRSGVEDIQYFGEIFQIARRSGGDLAQIIEKLVKVISEKIRVRKDIDVAIAGKRFEQMIMSIVPGGIIVYMQITSDGFLDVLYHNVFGIFIMSLCLLIYIFSFGLGRKIIRISI